MFETSPTIAALAKALSAAQGEVEGAVKGKANPAFRSKYADLAAVWDACREALTKHGLAIVQSPGPCADGRMEMTTLLAHSSGEWMRGTLTIPLAKVDAQAYGSATTYARRYALAAFVGIAPEDDDGNAAAAAAPRREAPAPVGQPKATLNQRAERFAATLRAVSSVDELDKAFSLGSKLCAELDAADPDLLAEVTQVYEARLAALTDRVAA